MTAAQLLRITERCRVTAGYNGTCESAVGYDAFVAGLREMAAHDDPAQRARLLEAHRLLRRARPRGGGYVIGADGHGWRAYVGGGWIRGAGCHADPVAAAERAITDFNKLNGALLYR